MNPCSNLSSKFRTNPLVYHHLYQFPKTAWVATTSQPMVWVHTASARQKKKIVLTNDLNNFLEIVLEHHKNKILHHQCLSTGVFRHDRKSTLSQMLTHERFKTISHDSRQKCQEENHLIKSTVSRTASRTVRRNVEQVL